MHMGAVGCCISCGKSHNVVAKFNDGIYTGGFTCCDNQYSFSGSDISKMNAKFIPGEKFRQSVVQADPITPTIPASMLKEIDTIAQMAEATKLSKENMCVRHNMPLILSTGIGRPACPGCVSEGVKKFESKNRSNTTLIILISMLAAAAASAGFNGTVEKIASLLPSEILTK